MTYDDGSSATEMTYAVQYRVGLGAIGRLVDRLQKPTMRHGMRQSMRNLSDLLIAESD